MKIINITRSTVLADEAQIALDLFSRARGLLGRKSLKDNEALIISNCKSIHTFFMQFPIDVLFVDKYSRIIGIKKAIVPFRLTPIYFGSQFAVELPAQKIEATATQINDIISIEA